MAEVISSTKIDVVSTFLDTKYGNPDCLNCLRLRIEFLEMCFTKWNAKDKS